MFFKHFKIQINSESNNETITCKYLESKLKCTTTIKTEPLLAKCLNKKNFKTSTLT